jgi:hypothetical protein
MPIIADFGEKNRFVIDWVHKQGTQAVTVPLVVEAIRKHYVTELHIEQNSGGKLITDTIKAEMANQDVRHCRIIPYYASTRLPKDEKIKGYSDWVKTQFKFIIPKKYVNNASELIIQPQYVRSEMYQKAMDELEMYSAEGKNPHDDAPDALSQLAIVMDRKKHATNIIKSPF